MPPFRGGINNPELVELEVEQYSGYHTATIQSAVRYDMPYSSYRKVAETIIGHAGRKPKPLDVDEVSGLIEAASSEYRRVLARVAPFIVAYSSFIPRTRARRSWAEYGRSVDGRRLPRAIVFTSSLYLAGLPPTLLDAPGILRLYREERLDRLLKLLPALRHEVEFDLRYYVPDVACQRLDCKLVSTVNEALEVLGLKPEPDQEYATLLRRTPSRDLVLELARIRGFLG